MRRVESISRPRWLRVLAATVAALATFALPAAAQAAYEKVEELEVPVEIPSPVGFSLDAVNGHYYITDQASGETSGSYRFDLEGQAAGPPLVPGGKPRAVANHPLTGDAYVFQDGKQEIGEEEFADVPKVSRFTPIGAPIGDSWLVPNVPNLMSMLGTAVGNDGSVYMPTNIMGNNVVHFSSTGVAQDPITGEDASQLVAPAGAGVDSSGQTFVLDGVSIVSGLAPGGRIQVFDADGDFVEVVATAGAGDKFQTMAVNHANGDVWVTEVQDTETPEAAMYLVRYEDNGGYERTDEVELEGFDAPVSFLAWARPAVDPESGKVYVFLFEERMVRVYAEPLPPVVETEGATGISQTKATVNGKVDPSGQSTTCHFVYGTGGSLDKQVPCKVGPGSGEGLVPVSADLSSLSANTEYEFRLVAENDAGETEGDVAEFKTLANTCATDSSLCPPPDPPAPPAPPAPPVVPAAPAPAPAPAPPATKPLKCKKGFKKKKVKGKQKCVKVQKKKGKGKKK